MVFHIETIDILRKTAQAKALVIRDEGLNQKKVAYYWSTQPLENQESVTPCR